MGGLLEAEPGGGSYLESIRKNWFLIYWSLEISKKYYILPLKHEKIGTNKGGI